MGKLFGTDGIRGRANEYPMTAEMALKVGKAVGRVFRGSGSAARIVVGRDTRISGGMIEAALIAGLCATGADTVVAGILPTPGVAFLAKSMGLDGGIVISASHNPFYDNGIKLFNRDGFKLSDEKERQIEQLVLSDDQPGEAIEPHLLGRARPIGNGQARYVEFLKQVVPEKGLLHGLKVVLDCGNGATHEVAPSAFRELGASVRTICVDPDGKNINEACGSEHPERLADEVLNFGASLGLAFDGDGDRVVAVDEKGAVLRGDKILTICVKTMKQEGRLANNAVVSTVMSNMGFRQAIKQMGVRQVTTQVGDRHVLREMLASGIRIGGEDSGHVIFLDHHTTGDGIITALNLVVSMRKAGKSLSELGRLMEVFPQKLINVVVKRKPPIDSVVEIAGAIRQVEEALDEKGRVLVRYSGTQPMCRVMVEGPTEEETDRYCRRIADVVRTNLA